ncbi:MAG: aconitate hydratase AcnA [Phycisphaerae bacterium]|nr:aconitate hydratase AcnA [Phycisphaerae bacterium]
MPSNEHKNPFGAAAALQTSGGTVRLYRLAKLSADGIGHVERLPFSIKVLLENVLRNVDGFVVHPEHVTALADWQPKAHKAAELPFMPGRVLLQDFTGVPAVVDLAAMRSAMARLGGDPKRINPQVPCDLVIDHSVQIDAFGSADALRINMAKEFERNQERYEFLRWGQNAFDNFRVVPPGAGIVHQVNLEYLAQGVLTREQDGRVVALPDSLVGTDSHTTMINGLGVVGWGVGGIEAEAVMLGQPIYMLTPEVVGFRLFGELPEGATATDLVLTVTQMLRAKGVVGKFVEFCGEALATLTLPDRATLANMAPEYGATMGFFPIDDMTLDYLRMTGRSRNQIDLVERYTKEQGLFRDPGPALPAFTDLLELDLSTVEPSLAGPKRPQDRVPLTEMKPAFRASLGTPVAARGFALDETAQQRKATIDQDGASATIRHGAVVIASITSCTNTSNPSVMLAAGLVARKAVEKGLRVKPYVKTSLAPGSRVVTDYLQAAGLSDYLDRLGFQTVGYGCATCIGNSGPLPEPVTRAITDADLVVCSVLSGNRNFEGRINPHVKANYLASPPLVVAYALAGTVDVDLMTEPLGTGSDGKPVYLRDIWPRNAEIAATLSTAVKPEQFTAQYADVFAGTEAWNAVSTGEGELFDWQADSTYIQEPPFFLDMKPEPDPIHPIRGARVLAMVADSVTTDHISPAGAIKSDSPAGRFLQEHGVRPTEFNSYGSRRGNDRVMTRGTFANVRLRNLLAPGTEGGVTVHLPSGEIMTTFEAAMKYGAENTPLIVLAGKEYGTGSSRDWAAKGTRLLGVRAVLAESFERIHRSNLVGMGVLPLQFKDGQTCESLGLSGHETFDINLEAPLEPLSDAMIVASGEGVAPKCFSVTVRIDTPVEVEYYLHQGILPCVVRTMLKRSVRES